MGWIWRDDGDGDGNSGEINSFENENPRSEAQCSTRKIVSSKCRTEEVEPGKFIKKCEKTEQLLKDFVGRPSEVVESKSEYTEEDVTEQMSKGNSFPMQSSDLVPFDFPGLRSDIEAIERNLFGNMNRFFESAEDIKNDFFSIFGSPNLYDGDSKSPPPPATRVTPIEPRRSKESCSVKPKNHDGDVDLSGLARDV